jgi:hypothetical protein
MLGLFAKAEEQTWDFSSLKISAVPREDAEFEIYPEGKQEVLDVYFSESSGWPQVNITLPKLQNTAFNAILVKIKLMEPKKLNTGITSAILPDIPGGRYFNTELKHGEYVDIIFNVNRLLEASHLRIAAKTPKEDVHLRIGEIKFIQVKSLSDGIGFESAGEIGRWTPWNSTIAVTEEYAFRGKKSFKMRFEDSEAGVYFYPDIRDWSKYKYFKFVIYNPAVTQKYRILLIEDDKGRHYLPPNCSIPGGQLQVGPEAAKEFELDLQDQNLLEKINIKDIRSIMIYKGTPETSFFIDEMRLQTLEDVERESIGVLKEQISGVINKLEEISDKGIEYYTQQKRSIISNLKCFMGKDVFEKSEVEPIITEANELLVVLTLIRDELAKDKDGDDNNLLTVSVTSGENVFRDLPFKYSTTPRELMCAGNEWESFQLVVAPLKPLNDVILEATDLVNVEDSDSIIDASNVVINPVGYVYIKNAYYYPDSSRTGWWPDPLINNVPIDIKNRIQPFWISVYVPTDHKPGVYKGSILISSSESQVETYEYFVNVRNFSLPVQGELKTILSITYSPQNQETRRKVYDLFLKHRLNPTNMYINAGVENGYQPAKEDLQFCLERGLNEIVIWNPYNRNNPDNPYSFDNEYKERMAAFIRDYKAILEEHNAWDMALVLGFDEVMHKDSEAKRKGMEGAADICSFLKQEFPDLRIANIGAQLEIDHDLMDIWIPGSGIYPDLIASDKDIYFYKVYGDPSYMLDLPGIAPRVISWEAFKYGAKGISYYSTIRGVKFAEAPQGVDWDPDIYNVETTKRLGRNLDGSLVYPARDGSILSSIRLENTRDGIEDFEYLALLRKLSGGQDPLLNIPDDIVTLKSYSRNPDDFYEYRRRVADAIEEYLKKVK